MKENRTLYTTLVLVTDQFTCSRIIKAASVISELSKTRLLVLSVMRDGAQINPQALEHLFEVAREYDAQMSVEFSDNPEAAIVHFMRENHVVNAITGIPKDETSILVHMWNTIPNMRFFTVTEEGELREVIEREYQLLKDSFDAFSTM